MKKLAAIPGEPGNRYEIQQINHNINLALGPLIHVRNNNPFTNSLIVAESVGLKHKRVIELIRKYKNDFLEFGKLPFRTAVVSSKGAGESTEYAELNEDQATYLITLFRNSDTVRKFKIKLVKAFRNALNEISRIKNQKSEPSWKYIRDETKLGFKWMADNLKEQRLAIGKETKNVHYMVEAKLINGVINGVFAGMDRNMLPSKDLAMIADLQRYNARLIAQDVPYAERKTMLVSYLAPKLQELREVVA